MSLTKQLWLIILVLLLLAFGGSLFISVTTSRHYIEQEVRIKNADNANALALSMSQLDKDPVNIALLMAAQFDTGHYRLIELHAPDGSLIERRKGGEHIEDVPAWFVELVRFEVPPGQAVVQDGWRQFGTLTLQGQHSFAYRSLWQSTLNLLGWFALAGALSLALAALFVRGIRRPLLGVVHQAREIGQRRFTTSQVPRTRELGEVVEAMNQLSGSVKAMLEQEGERLDSLRRRLQHDAVTGLLNRQAFIRQLEATLARNDQRASGTLAIVRVSQLQALSETLGHERTDALLRALGQHLEQLGALHDSGVAGRLNGSDMALLIPAHTSATTLGEALLRRLEALRASVSEASLILPSALISYAQGDHLSDLMTSLDGALASAELQGDLAQRIVEADQPPPLYTSHAEWREALATALQEGVYLGRFPVMDAQGHLLHMECPARLRLKGEWRSAGLFMPWLSRLGMEAELDLAVLRITLKEITRHGKPLGVNLSPASVCNARFVLELHGLLQAYREAAAHLWLEVPETMVLHRLDSFRSLCRELQPFGCRVGLEHAGREFRRISDLQDLGLAFLKVDASLVRDIPNRPEQQTILRGMATLCHALGILVIAEGVATGEESATLFELGLDGVTGPGVRQNDRPA